MDSGCSYLAAFDALSGAASWIKSPGPFALELGDHSNSRILPNHSGSAMKLRCLLELNE